MKLKTTISFLFFIVCSHLSYSQEKPQICSCLLLKETEENDTKVIALAEYVEASLHNLSTDEFNEKFDVPSFINGVTNHQLIDSENSFTKNFMEGTSTIGKQLSQQLVNLIETGSYYNLINYRYNIVDRAYYFTFRLFSEETGVNYHDYKVCSNGETLKFNDIYIYLTGEPLSTTMQRIFLLSKPIGKEDAYALNSDNHRNVFLFLESQKLAKKGKYEAAFNTISKITSPMAEEKFTRLTKANYAMAYDGKMYEVLLEEYAEQFPKDPTLYLKLIDYYIVKGNFKLAIKNIDKLMYETDDDFLNLLKGNVYMLSEDYETAESHYGYIMQNYPDLFQGYIGYIVSLNFQNRFEDIIIVIEDLLEQGYDREALLEFIEESEADGSNQIDAFLSSKKYKKWKRKSKS
ncbi:tetratricopeptide repeat protein [Winogradskyella vidalii]|uniref:tetratricopeptide repeat protein n=1 Tax=Winogradskyella vidalii TaxID=2615024 RepID=UPI0015C73EA4|nr:hypothetical protein [Winogradskyella vidalii]